MRVSSVTRSREYGRFSCQRASPAVPPRAPVQQLGATSGSATAGVTSAASGVLGKP
ncbi:MAG: hypothetical protein ABJA80_17910 [bacterium]